MESNELTNKELRVKLSLAENTISSHEIIIDEIGHVLKHRLQSDIDIVQIFETLFKYTEHKDHCSWMESGSCDCGLDTTKRKLNNMLDHSRLSHEKMASGS